ncbi:MAG: TonB-dependent receptor [Ginsengibacter sp.]
MKLFKQFIQGFLPLFLVTFLTVSTNAQKTINVYGTVKDAELNQLLPGAVVELQSKATYKTVTDDHGYYNFEDLPTGTYKLKITYVNYKEYTTEFIAGGNNTSIEKDINMESLFKVLSPIAVAGNLFGQAKALNTQKEAVNIKNVISEQQIESFPDINTAEVLQRVPGVTVIRSAGEARFVGIRGTNPSFTNVTINGSQLASSNGSDRSVELDVINAGQLGGIEVSKVITPDQDANAIGGSINLKTRSAFDNTKTVLNVLGGIGYAAGAGFRGGINYSERYGKKRNLGLTLGASYNRTNRRETSDEQDWGDRKSTTNESLPLALRGITLRESNNIRDRLGLTGQMEYKFNKNNQIGISALFNKRWDDQWRNDLNAKIDKGKYISYTDVTGARFIKATQDRVERQIANDFEIFGVNQVGKLKIEYRGSYSKAYTKKSDGQLAPEFDYNNINLTLTDLDTRYPNYIVTNDKNVLQGSNYIFDQTDYRFENTNDKIYSGRVNFSLPVNFTEKSTGDIKFGVKYRANNKDRKDIRQQYKWKGSNSLHMSQFEDNRTIDGFQDGHYNLGKEISTDKFRNFFLNHQSDTGFVHTDRPDVNFGEPYTANEDVTSTYVMGTQTFGKLLVLAGVRAEFVNTDYTGNNLVLNNKDFVSAVSQNVKRSYYHFFPNLQFRYRITPATNLRLAYSQGLAYPDFYDLTPYSITDMDPSAQTITRGNGYLKPTTTKNIDLLGEYFFRRIGILSAGMFYKDLNRFIFSNIGTQDTGIYQGYRYTEPVNGNGAKLYGFELSWQQQFTFLPGFLNGFGIYSNYTYTYSKDIDLGEGVDRKDISLLPGQMQHVGNLALTYEKYGLTARVAASFSGKFINKVGVSSEYDEIVKSYTQFDFSASQRVLKKIDLFVQWQNIFNQPNYTYTGHEYRSRKFGYTGTTFYGGLKWSLN